jgi:hypothetical protein
VASDRLPLIWDDGPNDGDGWRAQSRRPGQDPDGGTKPLLWRIDVHPRRGTFTLARTDEELAALYEREREFVQLSEAKHHCQELEKLL